MKRFFLLVMLLVFISRAQAQESFLIYSLKGNVMVEENNKKSKAKIGDLLGNTTRLTLAANTTVTLICNQANLITINKAGNYLLSGYKDQCNEKPNSISSNYLKYVWTQLTQKPGSPEKNRKMFMNNVGAVSRNVNNVWIDPRLDTLYYTSGNFPLSWKSYAEADDFEWMVFDSAKDAKPLFSISTKNQFVNLNEISSQLQKGKSYYWTAAIKGQQNSERKVVQLWEKQKFEELLKTLSAPEDAYEHDAARYFRQAFLLEQAHFLAEAYTYYQKAVSLQPETELYTATLKSFKKDYNIQ